MIEAYFLYPQHERMSETTDQTWLDQVLLPNANISNYITRETCSNTNLFAHCNQQLKSLIGCAVVCNVFEERQIKR